MSGPVSGPVSGAVSGAVTGPPPAELPALGIRGWARWAWRQLTSMRVALVLLVLLALAAIPGSVVPQTPVNPVAVADYHRAHPGLSRIFDKVSMFDVFSSVWFSAIYLLLLVSLVGCVIPRSR